MNAIVINKKNEIRGSNLQQIRKNRCNHKLEKNEFKMIKSTIFIIMFVSNLILLPLTY